MTREEISQAIGEIKTEYIEEAADEEKSRKRYIPRSIKLILSAAACAVIAVALMFKMNGLPVIENTEGGMESEACGQAANSMPPETNEKDDQCDTAVPQENQTQMLRVKIKECRENEIVAEVLEENGYFAQGSTVGIMLWQSESDKTQNSGQAAARECVYAQYSEMIENASEGDEIEIRLSEKGKDEKMFIIMPKKAGS